jgi:hypothetical protein
MNNSVFYLWIVLKDVRSAQPSSERILGALCSGIKGQGMKEISQLQPVPRPRKLSPIRIASPNTIHGVLLGELSTRTDTSAPSHLPYSTAKVSILQKDCVLPKTSFMIPSKFL